MNVLSRHHQSALASAIRYPDADLTRRLREGFKVQVKGQARVGSEKLLEGFLANMRT